jgi:hypothetical protein
MRAGMAQFFRLLDIGDGQPDHSVKGDADGLLGAAFALAFAFAPLVADAGVSMPCLGVLTALSHLAGWNRCLAPSVSRSEKVRPAVAAVNLASREQPGERPGERHASAYNGHIAHDFGHRDFQSASAATVRALKTIT